MLRDGIAIALSDVGIAVVASDTPVLLTSDALGRRFGRALQVMAIVALLHETLSSPALRPVRRPGPLIRAGMGAAIGLIYRGVPGSGQRVRRGGAVTLLGRRKARHRRAVSAR